MLHCKGIIHVDNFTMNFWLLTTTHRPLAASVYQDQAEKNLQPDLARNLSRSFLLAGKSCPGSLV